MTQAFKPNIFNIASNYNFFDELFYWLQKNFGNQISEAKIFFPNRRACREFENIFLQKFGNGVKLPKIKAIADISYEDFLDSFPKSQISSIINELSQIKRLSDFDYLFFLSEEIIKAKVFGENLSLSQAFSIAIQLKNLFDEIERQEVDFGLIAEIDDSDLALHRQFTLDFLRKFYFRVRNSVLKENVFSSAAYQNFIINKLAWAVENQGLKSPLIIAGSTGSVNYSKELIKAVAKDKNGFVVLYGLNTGFTGIIDESHPQFILNELLKNLEVSKKDVVEIALEEFKICKKRRLDFISYLTLSSAQTHEWQGLEKKIDLEKLSNDFQNNLAIIEAKNEIEEAQIIALQASQAVLKNQKVAIILPDFKFVEMLKIELQKLSLQFSDARGLDLSNCKLTNLILLLLELCENNFTSATLLAILKHEYSPFLNDKNLSDFEILILREQRISDDLRGIKNKLKSQNEELQNFFNGFLDSIESLLDIGFELDLSSYTNAIIKVVENFTKQNFVDLIAKEPALEELSKLFERLQSIKHFSILQKNSRQFFEHLFAQIKYFEKSDFSAQIQLVSPIEARLLNFDLLILTSLNQGIFPQIEGDNWLGKKIRKELAIDLTAKRVGQNAYDFCNYLSNKSIILTRSKTAAGALTIASPFILKLQMLNKKFAIEIKDLSQDILVKNQETYQSQITNNKYLQQLQTAKPPLSARPKKLAITDISQLISNPYQIYAKRILQLRELNKIDYEPQYREFGSFIHKVLEEFVKNNQPQNFIKRAEEIFAQFFLNEEAKLIWWPKFENIFINFIEDNNALKPYKNYVEVPVKLLIKDILLAGKIDRVSFFESDEIEIFDYKTGQIPTAASVKSGDEPQLTIAALMLCFGAIENADLKNISPQKIRSLNYWKLSSFGEGEIKKVAKSSVVSAKEGMINTKSAGKKIESEEITILISAAKAGLEQLFEYFSDEKNGYFINPNAKNEYSHLARIF